MADVSVTAARGLALWSAAVALVLLALGWRTMRRQIDAVDHRRRDAVPGRRGAAGGGHPA